MAITTVDGIVAGMVPGFPFQKNAFTGEAAGQIANLGVVAGNPGAWTLSAPGLAGAVVTTGTIGGAFPFANPATGNTYLAKLALAVGANIIGFEIYDLLWYNTGIIVTTTTAQTVNSVAFPARCVPATGSTPDTLGGRIQIWMHCTTATTNAAAIANTTLGYTNQDGTTGRSAGLAYSWPATAVAGTMVPFGLQGNDTGVRSIQTVTLGTSYGGGAVNLLAVRSIASVYFPTATAGGIFDFADLGLPRLYDSSALYMNVLLSGTAAGITVGHAKYTQG